MKWMSVIGTASVVGAVLAACGSDDGGDAFGARDGVLERALGQGHLAPGTGALLPGLVLITILVTGCGPGVRRDAAAEEQDFSTRVREDFSAALSTGFDYLIAMASVLDRFANEPGAWDELSARGIERVAERYNWPLYAKRLLDLSRIYGFWKYISSLERDEPRRYLEMFYGLMYRPLAKGVAAAGEGAVDG